MFDIRTLDTNDKDWLRHHVTQLWGAGIVVAHDKVFYPVSLPGFVAIESDESGINRIGLITYEIDGKQCEIVTLDSLQPSRGIGTALIDAVKRLAREAGCERLWLITTNDNVDALRFYQRRGFVLAALHANTLAESHRLKPEIPLIGNYGIPLLDEIELEMAL
jgi:ribosomal protein S18 acetylase RimI-like enzyme